MQTGGKNKPKGKKIVRSDVIFYLLRSSNASAHFLFIFMASL